MPGGHPRLSVSLVSLRQLPPAAACAILADCGVDAVSATMARLSEGRPSLATAMAECDLRPVSLGTGGSALIGRGADPARVMEPLIDAAASLGFAEAFTVSGPAPAGMPTDEAFDVLARTLGPAVDAARDRGVTLSVEHSSPATRPLGFINTLSDAFDLADATGCGVIVELQNCWYERRLPELFRRNLSHIRLVQVSDFIVGEDLRFNRRVPGDGAIPIAWLIATLLEAGYAGRFEIELIGPAIDAEGGETAVRRAVEWLANCLAALDA